MLTGGDEKNYCFRQNVKFIVVELFFYWGVACGSGVCVWYKKW